MNKGKTYKISELRHVVGSDEQRVGQCGRHAADGHRYFGCGTMGRHRLYRYEPIGENGRPTNMSVPFPLCGECAKQVKPPTTQDVRFHTNILHKKDVDFYNAQLREWKPKL